MKKNIFRVTVLAAIFLTRPALGADTGAGSRAIALGETYTAISDDSSAIYWNPAGLIQLKQRELGLFNIFYKEDNKSFVGFAYPTEKIGYFGAAFSRHINFNELIESTTVQTDCENSLSFSYGRKLNPKFSAGITLNAIQRTKDNDPDTGVTADIGMLYKPMRNIVLGFSGKNIVDSQLNYGGNSYNIPYKYRLGLTYYLQIWREKLPLEKILPIKKIKSTSLSSEELLLSVDFEASENSDKIYIYRCLEFWLHDILAFRLGASKEIFEHGKTWNALFGIRDPTIGLGIRLNNFQLDISYARPEYPFSFQLTFKFGEKIASLEYSRWEIEKRTRQYFKAGEMLYKNNKFARALAEWEKALIWNPEDKELQDKIKRVQKKLEAVTNKKLIENYINQAYITYEEGNLLQSFDNWQKIIEIDPGNKRAKEYIEKINSKLTKAEKQKYLRELAQKQKEKIAKHMRNADIDLEKNKHHEAIAEWQKILKLKPSHSEAIENIKKTKSKISALVSLHYDKALDYHAQSDRLNAIKEFRKVLKLEPEHKEAKEYLGKLKKEAKPTKIVDIKEIVVDKKEINQLYYRAADLYLEGKYTESEKILNSLIAIDPFNENAIILLEKVKSVMATLNQ
jgi:tetratricopeptide (TPR) repeat protein